jgi:broad specificity phosphatase PhoE
VAVPTILLIRHGQASFGAEDYDQLSDTGIRQAEITAAALTARGLTPSRIISGSLLRQRDSAAPAARAFAIEPEVDPRWNEYAMDDIIAAHHDPDSSPSSAASGISSAAFQDILEVALSAWMSAAEHTTAPDTWPAFRARSRAALHELAGSLEPSTTALVFTSAGVIATICAGLLELPAPALLSLNRVAVNTAITKIAAGRRGVSLISFNDHGHLEAGGLVTYR